MSPVSLPLELMGIHLTLEPMRTSHDSDSPIDQKRNGGGRGAIPPEFGKIISKMAFEHRIYFIAERGVSSGVMADQIDPDRRTASIPQIVQRQELTYGADTPFVQNTLCVAIALLDTAFLPANFPRETGLMIALNVAQDLAAVYDIVIELRQHAEAILTKVAKGEISREHLPRTPNLKGRVEQAIYHLRKIQLDIQRLCGLFYCKMAPNSPWVESLRAGLSENDPFWGNFDVAEKILNDVANCRHAMTHEDSSKRLEVIDYDLNSDGALVSPTIAVKHPKLDWGRCDIIQFLDVKIEELQNIFAGFLATFCDRNVRLLSPIFSSSVQKLPDGELRNGSPFVWVTQMIAAPASLS